MAYATSIRYTNFQFDGTAITKIYDNQSLDYPYSSFTLVSHIYVTPVDAELDWSVQVGPVRPGPDETIVFGPITAAQDPGHYTITATVDLSGEGWRTIGITERNSGEAFLLSIIYPGHSSYSGGYMEFSPDFQYIESGVSAPYTYFPLYDNQSPSGITLANVVASGFTFEPSYNGNTLSYKGVKSVSWDDDNLEYGGPQLYMDPNNQKVVANNFKANNGQTERRMRAWFPIGDTLGNSWIADLTFIQKSINSEPSPSGLTPPDVPFVSGQTVTGLCGNIIKAVYKVNSGDEIIKIVQDYPPSQMKFKLEDGTNIDPEFINEPPQRYGFFFQPMDYGWPIEQSGYITIYIKDWDPIHNETVLPCFDGCANLVELYAPESVTSIGGGNLNRCQNLTNLVFTSPVDINNISSFDGAFSYPFPGSYSGVPSIVCLGACEPIDRKVFSNIGRNGTLYYPTGTDYSSWLSNENGGLGYRGWSGEAFTVGLIDCSALTPFDIPDQPIPSGSTVDSGSTSHTITYSGCPLVFDHSASTGTWDILPTVTTGGTTDDWWITYNVPANDTDSARTITYYYLRYSGETCEDLVDTVSYTISQAAGSGTPTPSANIWLPITEQTISANTSIPNNNYFYVGVKTSGCNMDSGAQTDITYTVSGANIVSGISQLRYVQTDTYNFQLYWNTNTSTSQREAYVTFTFKDTSGNTYNDTFHITQLGAKNIKIEPNLLMFQSGASVSSATIVGYNTTIQSINFYSSSITTGSFDVLPTFSLNDNQVIVNMPENPPGGQYRGGQIAYVAYDDVSKQYLLTLSFGQYPGYTPDRWVYLDPSGRTHNANTDGSSYFNIKGSGCSIDSAYTPTFTFSGDTTWIDSIERVYYNNTLSGWTALYPVSRNLGPSDREIYITANGVHDTDGNVYNGLVYHATQNWSAYTFLNYDTYATSSARTTETAEVVPVNTTICSVEIESAYTYTPNLWEGVEQLTVTLLGNYLTVVWPANPYDDLRHYNIDLRVVWGESCEKSTILSYNKWQNIKSTPTQKDIKAADADYSVGSGTGNASTTIQTSGCTYDHFTYITGGSFSVTATSGPDNTIVFTYPENPTNSTRTGYVYITFYDSDGNTYGPQTITFTQQAGSSPGPGPGPDPSTGYVLTTLTISDQEQHRYFVEARPGVVYSAAGQYYKTILACEARYSLYYVNSYGGVDVLPFKEKGWKKSDTITRFNYSRSFRNNTPEFENVNYMNEIKASWELHTGWLSDEQSKRMHELIESTIVYLYDAEEKTYTPVVMTDKKLEYKTYHNQGKKFYNYTVNVEESQSKERR